jgi:hypothetical protein
MHNWPAQTARAGRSEDFRFYRPRSGRKAGLMYPVRTQPLSLIFPGSARTGGKAGLTIPIRTLPSSLIVMGEFFTVLISLTVADMFTSIYRPAAMTGRYM